MVRCALKRPCPVPSVFVRRYFFLLLAWSKQPPVDMYNLPHYMCDLRPGKAQRIIWTRPA